MKKIYGMLILSSLLLTGCSGAFWGGTATGAGGAGASYELRARQQMNKIKEDLNAGRIDQREYDIRKDQIQQMSLAY
ncbi:MAG: hypothetical protein HYZ83_02975 [Candidatus Omnitrophica bacterium]|nr:hypothetical protein [Candidatus Omnitrophota bacterium]